MAEKPNDIEAIYNAALKKGTEAERSAYLDTVCADDAVLRARVEELLKAHEEAGDFLEAMNRECLVFDGCKLGKIVVGKPIGWAGRMLLLKAQVSAVLHSVEHLGIETKLSDDLVAVAGDNSASPISLDNLP